MSEVSTDKAYLSVDNVETIFAAGVTPFIAPNSNTTGQAGRSRNSEAMVNEVYAKLICNNLWCVILSQCELGIEAEFWQNEDRADQPAILSMKRNPVD